jgi:hypothetical protein
MLDAGGNVAGESVRFGGCEVHVFGAGFGVEIVERMLNLRVSIRDLEWLVASRTMACTSPA